MDEKDFKKHLKDLAEGHHHPEEHDWDASPKSHRSLRPKRNHTPNANPNQPLGKPGKLCGAGLPVCRRAFVLARTSARPRFRQSAAVLPFAKINTEPWDVV
jgi:hypothetical protein